MCFVNLQNIAEQLLRVTLFSEHLLLPETHLRKGSSNLGRCIAREPRTCGVKFGAIWTDDAFNQTAATGVLLQGLQRDETRDKQSEK